MFHLINLKKRLKEKSGISLIEIILYMGVGLIFILVLFQFFIFGIRLYSQAEEKYKVQTDTSIALDRFNKELRQAYQIVDAQTSSLTFRVYYPIDSLIPTQIRYFKDGKQIKKGSTKATGAFPNFVFNSSTEQINVALNNLSQTSNTIFTCYDSNDNQLTQPIIPGNITMIKINFSVDQPKSQSTFDLETNVQLRLTKKNL